MNEQRATNNKERTTPLPCQRHHFDIPQNVHYLNCAYQSPLMEHVESVAQFELAKKKTPYLYTVDDFFEPVKKLKRLFAQLIGSEDWERIAVMPSASYGFANIAHNLELNAGDNVLTVQEQFPSNIYPWKRLCGESGAELRIVDRQKTAAAWNDAILSKIDERTRLLSIPTLHWADGLIFDLTKIAAKARSVNALVVIDGTQSIGALAFDLNGIRPDAVICAAYKWLLGPYGTAVGYYGPYFDDKKPIEENWINREDSDQFQQLVNYQDAYRPKAHRFCVGQCSNFIYVAMLNASIERILEWTPENVQEYCRELIKPGIKEIQELGFAVAPAADRAAHLFGIGIPDDVEMPALKHAMAENSVFVSYRGRNIRVAPHVYNTAQDMSALVEALRMVRSGVAV